MDMFLPNTDSFLLIRRTIVVEPSFPVFLPNTDSFLLIRRPIVVEPSFPVFLPNTDSFLLRRRPIVDPVRGKTSLKEGSSADHAFQAGRTSNGTEQSKIKDQGKRTFLKVASIAGASAIASQILSPKKASAFIMGSSPTTGVVGVKDSTNARINPATEETVSTLATQATAATLLKTSDLTFDTGNLQVKVTSAPSSFSDSGSVDKKGLVDADRHVQIDVLSSALPTTASTETTLETISFGGKKYALRLVTDGNIDYVGEADTGTAASSALWRAKKIDSNSGIIITWADGNANFDNVATDLTALTYS